MEQKFIETRDSSLLRDPNSNPHPEGAKAHDWRIDQAAKLATAEATVPSEAIEQPLPEEA